MLKDIENKQNDLIAKKRNRIRRQLRKYEILPPYGDALNPEQEIMWYKISNNDFEFYNELFPKPASISNDEYTKREINVKRAKYRDKLRAKGILSQHGETLSDEEINIMNQIMNDDFSLLENYNRERGFHDGVSKLNKSTRKKREKIRAKLRECGVLPPYGTIHNEQQLTILDEINNDNYSSYEKLTGKKVVQYVPLTPNPKESGKRHKVRTYLRKKGILPPYGSELTLEQNLINEQIQNGDFSFYENYIIENKPQRKLSIYVKKGRELETILIEHAQGKFPFITKEELSGYTSFKIWKKENQDTLNKHLKINYIINNCRNKGLLPPLGEELNETQQKIWDDLKIGDYSIYEASLKRHELKLNKIKTLDVTKNKIIKRLQHLKILPHDINDLTDYEKQLMDNLNAHNFIGLDYVNKKTFIKTIEDEINYKIRVMKDPNTKWKILLRTIYKTKDDESKQTLRKKRYYVVQYLRKHNLLPPSGQPLNDEHRKIHMQIAANDFSVYETHLPIKRFRTCKLSPTIMHKEQSVRNKIKRAIKDIISKNLPNETEILNQLQLGDFSLYNDIKDRELYKKLILGKNSTNGIRMRWYINNNHLPQIGEVLTDEELILFREIRNNIHPLYDNNRWSNKNKPKKSLEEILLNRAKGNALTKKIDFNLTIDDIVIPNICPYLELQLTADSSPQYRQNTFSIDRIDPNGGYVKGNIRIISRFANTMKSNATKEQLLIFAKNIIRLHGSD